MRFHATYETCDPLVSFLFLCLNHGLKHIATIFIVFD